MEYLGDKFPELIKEWHPTKNGDMTPFNTACYSNKPAVWICSKGHSDYSMIIANKTRSKQGCPYCAGKKVCAENSLLTLAPEIAKQWHPLKNNGLSPSCVTSRSNKKIWWLCDKCKYEWEATPNKRVGNRQGCSKCAGNIISDKNSLSINFPELLKEWDYEKNYPVTPDKVFIHSSYMAYWKCKRLHSYRMRIDHRTSGHGCKRCNGGTSRLERFIFVELRELFSNVLSRHKIDGCECDIFLPDYNIAIEIDGYHWHKGNSTYDYKKYRVLKSLGILLVNVRENGLSMVSDYTVEYKKPDDIFFITQKLFSTLFEIIKDARLKDYQERANPINPSAYYVDLSGYGRVPLDKSLAYCYPLIAKEWDDKKNGNLTPFDVTANSGLSVNWKCGLGHSWVAVVNNRTGKGTNCPRCWEIRRKNLHNYKIS